MREKVYIRATSSLGGIWRSPMLVKEDSFGIDGSRLILYNLFSNKSRRVHVLEGVTLTERFASLTLSLASKFKDLDLLTDSSSDKSWFPIRAIDDGSSEGSISVYNSAKVAEHVLKYQRGTFDHGIVREALLQGKECWKHREFAYHFWLDADLVDE